MLALLNQLAVSFDLPILDWIQAHLQCGFLDAVMPIVTLFGEGGIFWIAWAVLMLVFPKTRKTGIAMGIALVMGVLICNVTLKPLVARPRPYDFQYENFGITIKLLIDAQHDYSFPSGHTIASFEAAIPLMIYDKRMGIPAMVIAVLVTFSRLYLYVHWPTVVLGGILVGAAAGWAGARLADALRRRRERLGRRA